MADQQANAQTESTTNPQEAPGLQNMENPLIGSPDLSSSPTGDRRGSAEWDASKVPPSRFQKRKGSIYAVPASRDGHVESNYAQKYHDKLAEKGWNKK